MLHKSYGAATPSTCHNRMRHGEVEAATTIQLMINLNFSHVYSACSSHHLHLLVSRQFNDANSTLGTNNISAMAQSEWALSGHHSSAVYILKTRYEDKHHSDCNEHSESFNQGIEFNCLFV